MKKDQVIILEKRGLIFVSGEDAKDFLQNIFRNPYFPSDKTCYPIE